MKQQEGQPKKQLVKTCKDYHEEFDKIYDAKAIEDALLELSAGPGQYPTITGPAWLCKMFEESIEEWQKK